jgi:hypothetical protein
MREHDGNPTKLIPKLAWHVNWFLTALCILFSTYLVSTPGYRNAFPEPPGPGNPLWLTCSIAITAILGAAASGLMAARCYRRTIVAECGLAGLVSEALSMETIVRFTSFFLSFALIVFVVIEIYSS